MTIKQKQGVYLLTISVLLLGGLVLILLGQPVTASVGTSLLASGIVGGLDWFYRWITTNDGMTAEEILSSGLKSVYSRRDLDKYHELMTTLSSQLDIAGYSLRRFTESFGGLLVERINSNPRLHARLLLVDPDSVHSQRREIIERTHAPLTFKSSVDSTIDKFGKIPGVEIRLLDDDLTTMVFRLENTMFVGPQFMSSPSAATATFEIHKANDAWLFKQFEQEFETMWKAARRVG